MSRRSIIEVLLDRVEVAERGGDRRRKTRHLVLAALVWPRPTIAERTAMKNLEFNAGGVDLGDKDWTDRVLFKETVQGPFGIKIDVSDVVTDSQVAEFLRVMASSVLKLAGDEIAGLAAAPFVAGLVKVPFRHGSKLITASGKKTTRVIAEGQVDIGATQVAEGRESVIKVPLVAPVRIDRVTRTTTRGSVRTRRRTLLKKGEPNGRVILRVRRYR